MALSFARITASTVAVALNTAATAGLRLLLKNESANAADLGGPTVTAGAGLSLAAGASLAVQLGPTDVLFAIRSAASDAVISVIRT